MSNNAQRNTRKKKIANEVPPVHKDKFNEQEPSQKAAQKLTAATPNQSKQIKYQNEGRKVVFAIGAAGSGKSYLAAHHASEQLRKNHIEQIILLRPNVAAGKSLGMLPGTLEEKLAVFFTQTVDHLCKFAGKSFIDYALRVGKVRMQSFEHLRGLSIENAVVICEESQNLTAEELEMTLSRIGENCQIIFTGDQKQTDLKSDSGLMKTVELIQKTIEEQPHYMEDEDLQQLENNIGVVNYTMADVVRSGLCKSFVKMYHHN